MSWPALFVSFSSMAAMACGGSAPDAPSAVVDGMAELAPGQSAQVGALRITFVGVTGDSRCPIDVVCVWEGDAVSRLTLSEPSRDPETRELHTSNPRPAVYGGFQVELVQLAPAPRSTQPIPPDAYRLIVRVTPAS